jgi:hypothetical protein
MRLSKKFYPWIYYQLPRSMAIFIKWEGPGEENSPGGSSTYPLNSTLEIQMGVILDLVDIFRVKDNQWSHRDELKDIGPLFHFGQFEAGV